MLYIHFVGIDVRCEEGTVHLVGGDHISRGRVMVCYEGRWHSVCTTGFGPEEARVVCKTLGYDLFLNGDESGAFTSLVIFPL